MSATNTLHLEQLRRFYDFGVIYKCLDLLTYLLSQVFCCHVQVPANHLLSASFMSAPAALAISKLFYPETAKSKTTVKDVKKLAKGCVRLFSMFCSSFTSFIYVRWRPNLNELYSLRRYRKLDQQSASNSIEGCIILILRTISSILHTLTRTSFLSVLLYVNFSVSFSLCY